MNFNPKPNYKRETKLSPSRSSVSIVDTKLILQRILNFKLKQKLHLKDNLSLVSAKNPQIFSYL